MFKKEKLRYREYWSEIRCSFPTYSIVTEWGNGYARFNADFFFCFTITYRTPLLQLPLYSQYQFFLYETISDLREKEMSFKQIAQWLNDNNYQTLRGKSFKSAHVHSIIMKKRIKDEKLEKEYPEVRSDFRLETFDKRLIAE